MLGKHMDMDEILELIGLVHCIDSSELELPELVVKLVDQIVYVPEQLVEQLVEAVVLVLGIQMDEVELHFEVTVRNMDLLEDCIQLTLV